MYYVYVLKSNRHEFIYIGSTPDLERRFLEHNAGKVKSTKYYSPLELIYYEAYINKEDALSRESKLKHHGSVVGHLKRRLKNTLSCREYFPGGKWGVPRPFGEIDKDVCPKG